MAGLPNVSIEILNGQLGRVSPVADGVAGLMLSGVAVGDVALGSPKQIFSLEEAEDLGINEAYDTTNTTNVWKQIKEFYQRAGDGSELYFMICSKATKLVD